MTLFDIVTYSLWLSVGLGIFFFNKLDSKAIKLLVIFQTIAVSFDIFLIYILPKDKGVFIKAIYSILKPFEYTIYVYLFNSGTIKKGIKYYYLVCSIVVIFAFSIYTLLFLLSSKSAGTNLIILEGILVIILVMLYFKDVLNSKEIINLADDPLFLIGIGLLLFFSGNIIATGFYHQLKAQSPDFAKTLYRLMNHLVGIFQTIMFSYAYYKSYKLNRK